MLSRTNVHPDPMDFSHNVSPAWIESLFLLWKEDPRQLPPGWRGFFQGFELGQSPAEQGPGDDFALKNAAVQSLLYRYRDIGHLLACTDPLNPCPTDHPLLALEVFGLDRNDLDRSFRTNRFLRDRATLREILEVMRETYCRSIGVEYMHIQNPHERQWLRDRMEPVRNRRDFSRDEKLKILEKLLQAGSFENFLQRQFLGQKRFSLEGGEVLIPLLDSVVRRAGGMGIRDLVLGMPHRGRLNVLAHIFCKPLQNIFAEFEDNIEFGFVGEGDVKYHKGFSTDLTLPSGEEIHLAMASNPSHLEAVNPVVEGKCRALEDEYGPDSDRHVLPLLIHGDAAFSGQGIVAETLNLSQLEGYRTGGTLHIVLNNQIGFTTLPEDARSTLYATDIAKMLSVPIFHIHGEDPEAVLFAANLALEYRQEFGRDVVLEVICYRRQGHNEGDEPYFTQPLMYEKIRNRPPVQEIYSDRLREEGIENERIESLAHDIRERLEKSLNEKDSHPANLVGFKGKWSGIQREYKTLEIETGVETENLLRLVRKITSIPEGFSPHSKIERILQKRRERVESGKGIDWSTGEALGFASLLSEGTSVRLSGQDSRRGTFSQRHSTLFDVKTGDTHVPLSTVTSGDAAFNAFDSMLSEAAVLGFEYGYSLMSPHSLTIWEAQFGDFVNGAQVIIDQFIASSETKWDRFSGLTLFLPHGFEGQGPEHSSARMERFLQLCANDNIQVTYPSTPVQFFHLLRRQVKQPFRRPLVVLTPKALLRYPLCVSDLDEFTSGGFREVLPDKAEGGNIRTVLFCTGKIYYDLLEKRRESKREDLAIVRIEQIYPLRTEKIREALAHFDRAEHFAWVQEEPRNAGAWSFIRPCLIEVLGKDLPYIGRDEASSPAVGSHRLHKQEQEKIMEEAFRV